MNFLIKEGLIKNRGKRELLPMQQGDVMKTFADVSKLENDFAFCRINQRTKNIWPLIFTVSISVIFSLIEFCTPIETFFLEL